MSMIRPSLILNVDVDERLYSKDLVAEIKRTYSYVAPSIVASHAPAADDAENTIRFDVKLHQPYWDKNDSEADALWTEVMPKWLHNMFYKVSSTIKAANDQYAEQGVAPLPYTWVEVRFGDNATIVLKTRADSSVDDEAIGWIEQVRALMAVGSLGEGVACVRIPSRESYEAQKAAALAAAAEADVESEAQAAAVEGQPEAAAEAADEVRAPEAAETAEAATGAQGRPALTVASFDPDTAVWGIEYADGTARSFDAAAGAFAE